MNSSYIRKRPRTEREVNMDKYYAYNNITKTSTNKTEKALAYFKYHKPYHCDL